MSFRKHHIFPGNQLRQNTEVPK